MTIAHVSLPTAPGPDVSIWWDLAKARSHRPTRCKVADLTVSDSPKLVTVRVLAPEFYRKGIPGFCGTDTASTILTEWSQLLQCRVAALCGGTWQRVFPKHGEIVIGHVKLPESLADRCIQLSGKRSLFFAKIDKQTQTKVMWLARDKEATAEEYFNSAVAQATQLKLPLALRQGGHNDLGIIGATNQQAFLKRPRNFELFGAPKYWSQEKVSVFLTKTQWKDADIKAKYRRGSHFIWLFRAVPAPTQNEDTEGSFWQFADAGGKCVFTVTPQTQSKMKNPPCEWLRGPSRNKFFSSQTEKNEEGLAQSAGTDLPATQLDASQGENHNGSQGQNPNQGGTAAAPEDRDRSPRRQLQQGTESLGRTGEGDSDPKQVFLKDFPGWNAVDCKGTGDCAFRTFAKGISVFQGKTLDEAALAREASKLRVMTVGYLIKHKDVLGPQWTPDPGATKEQCAGEDVPMDFADYCMLASKQKFWCDGLLLECLTKRLRTACVVFSWNKEDKLWQRSVIAQSFQGDVPTQIADGIPVVAMMLIKDHFWLLQPPTTDTPCPSAWLRKTSDRPRHLLKGAGKSTSLSLPSSSAKSVTKKTKSEPQKSKAQLRPSSELSLPASSVKPNKGQSQRTALSLPDRRSDRSQRTGTRHRTCASSNQVKTGPPVQKSGVKKGQF